MAVKFLWLLAAPVSIKVSPQIMGIIMTIWTIGIDWNANIYP
jgi:hypothetical protein